MASATKPLLLPLRRSRAYCSSSLARGFGRVKIRRAEPVSWYGDSLPAMPLRYTRVYTPVHRVPGLEPGFHGWPGGVGLVVGRGRRGVARTPSLPRSSYAILGDIRPSGAIILTGPIFIPAYRSPNGHPTRPALGRSAR